MHIIGIILSVAVFVVIWWARLKMLGEVANKAADVVDTAIKAPRRWAFKRQTSGNPVEHIDDARVGAVCLMFILASSDGVLDQNEVEIVQTQARLNFCETDQEAEELCDYGRWVAGRVVNGEQDAKKLVGKIHKLAPGAGSEMLKMIAALDARNCAEGLHEDIMALVRSKFKLLN